MDEGPENTTARNPFFKEMERPSAIIRKNRTLCSFALGSAH